MIGDHLDQDCWQCEHTTEQVVTSLTEEDLPATSECLDCGAENELT